MDIIDIVSADYVAFDADTSLSKRRGAFEDADLKAVLVEDTDGVKGVVSRLELATSHRLRARR